MTAPVYDDTTFRQQFPAFANTTSYPEAALSFAWNMGGNWLSQNQAAWWGVGAVNPAKLQQAADLMGAVIAFSLYGPGQQTGTGVDGQQNQSQQGGISGPITSASEGSVSASFSIPTIGSSAFRSWLLSCPPYGPMLLALLRTSAGVGPYKASCRPSWVPP
jgi:hypothetical protein